MAGIKLTNKKGRIVIDMQDKYFESLVRESHKNIEAMAKAGKNMQECYEELPVTTVMAGLGKALIEHMKDAPEGSKFTITT